MQCITPYLTEQEQCEPLDILSLEAVIGEYLDLSSKKDVLQSFTEVEAVDDVVAGLELPGMVDMAAHLQVSPS